MKKRLSKLIRNEKGQALAIVLALLAIGALTITPLLNHMYTGLSAGQIYDEKMTLSYAAEAGLEDAIWKTDNDKESLTSDPPQPDDPLWPYFYDGEHSEHTYSLPEEINGKSVSIDIKQIWPLAGLESDANGTTPASGLVVTGGVINAQGGFQVRLAYDTPEVELLIDGVAVWLPPGFEYVAGSSEGLIDDLPVEDQDPFERPWNGGTALEWDFNPAVDFADLPLPGQGDPLDGGMTPGAERPALRVLEFEVTPQEEIARGSYSWVRTTDTSRYLSWERNITIYRIDSTATDNTTGKSITASAYTYVSEGVDTDWIDTGGTLFTGNYRAIGNSLMLDTDGDPNHIRDVVLTESSSTVADIPGDGEVAFAYLYWAGWYYGEEEDTTCTFKIDLAEVISPNASGNYTECDPVGDFPNYQCVDDAVADDDSTYVESAYDLDILRPDASGSHTEFAPYGAPSNYQCVDEAVADENITYVATGEPEILRPNASGNYTECDPYPDPPNYQRVDEAAADDDSTYVLTGVMPEILRPNAAGDECNIFEATWPIDCPDHYVCVDEETPDEGSTVVETDEDWQRDLYNLPSHSEGSGTINYIKVYARARAEFTPNMTNLKLAIKTGGTAYESSEITLTTSWVDYSNQWNTNPQTGAAWTWDDIDALQIGLVLRRCNTSWDWSYCTQVYAEVSYYVVIEDLTTTLRPNVAGDETTITHQEPSSGAHWDKVDEVTADDWSTYVYTTDTPTPPSDWYNEDWQYRKKITIDHNKVEADLTNFPVLISITDSDLRDHAKSDGSDIVFTSSNGITKLKREIESYDNLSGTLVAWVKADLSSSSDTEIYLYYGNSAASETNDTDTWDSNFKMVQHLKDETTSSTADSTSNDNDGVKLAAGEPVEADGKISKAQDFDGSDDQIDASNSTDFDFDETDSFSYEAWINADDISDNIGDRIIAKREGTSSSTIAIGDVSYGTLPSGGSWTLTIEHTVSGTDRLLIVGVSIDPDWQEFVAGVTWNDTPLTHLASISQSDDARAEIWYLTAPETGTYDVVVTLQGDKDGPSQWSHAGAISFTGVDQTTPFGDASTFAAMTCPSIDVASSIGDVVFGVAAGEDATFTGVGAGQIEHWLLSAPGGEVVEGGGTTKDGEDVSTTISFTCDRGDHAAMVGVAIKPASQGYDVVGYDVSVRANGLQFAIADGTTEKTNTIESISTGTWYHVMVTIDRGADLAKLYVNGTEEASVDISAVGSPSNIVPLTISGHGGGDKYFDGTIDEVRISNIARSAGWIKTSYNNQSDPANFCSVGAEELVIALERDLYNVSDYSGETPVTGVTVYFRFSGDQVGVDDYTGYARAAIKTNGTVYLGSVESQMGKTFVTKSYTWTTNPYTASPWTWDEIAALQVGIELAGTITPTQAYCTQVYAEVDYLPVEIETDTYNIEDHSQGSGSINSVTVYVRSRGTVSGDTLAIETVIRTHDTDYFGTYTSAPTSYTELSTTYTTNPSTLSAWTWEEIDTLQAGVRQYNLGYGSVRTTQVYVEVDYGPPEEIDTYSVENKSGIGVVNSVTVRVRSRGTLSPGTHAAETVIRTHDTNYFGDNVTLPLSYTDLSTTYTTNPYTGSAWNWGEVNALEAGVKHYKLGDGSVRTTQVYIEVDYGLPFGEARMDTYNLEDHSLGSGTINSVTVYVISKGTSSPDTHAVETAIRTHGTDYFGTKTLLLTSYTELSTTYTTNPSTGLAWTWAEIDALEAGVKQYDQGAGLVRTTQVYVYIDYGVSYEGEITADTWWLVQNSTGYCYSCFKDVTSVVGSVNPGGNAIYTVGDVDSETGEQLSSSGWSLIIIYSSLSEEGHQFYLWNLLIFAGGNTEGTFIIEGFVAPEDAEATMTCFITEGDEHLTIETLQFNGTSLFNAPINPQGNIWNGKSSGLGGEIIDGVDIDTFDVSSPVINPGDTSAEIRFTTQSDHWNLIYLMLAFRSDLAILIPSGTGIYSYGF